MFELVPTEVFVSVYSKKLCKINVSSVDNGKMEKNGVVH